MPLRSNPNITAELDRINIPPALPNTKTIGGIVNESVVASLLDKKRLEGFKTQYPQLNSLVGGIRTGTLTILAATPGTGKTLFALNVLTYLAGAGVSSFYFDIENGLELSLERILRIKHGWTKSFFMDEKNASVILENAKEIGNMSYMDHVEISEIAKEQKDPASPYDKRRVEIISDIIRTEASNDVKVFLIDPLQAMVEGGSQGEFYEQGRVVQVLKELAQELNIAIIVCHHIRKGGRTADYIGNMEDAEAVRYVMPSTESIKGSGKITEFATDVWGLVRLYADTDAKKRGVSLLRVLKARTGLTGDVKLYLDTSTLVFHPVTLSRIENIVDKVFGANATLISPD